MTDLRIRAATPEDLDAVLAFWKVAAEGTSISDDRDGVERLVARDPEALILAEQGGELVGTVIAGFDGWRCHLYRLAVLPGRRRQGIGSALLAAAEGTSISDDRAGVERLVERDPEALVLAEQDGELVGTVIAGFDGWRCHLYRLAVHPGRRRQGIGSALLAAAEERLVRLGGRRGDAMVLVRNERAHHAWRAAGYAPEEHWRRWVKPLTG